MVIDNNTRWFVCEKNLAKKSSGLAVELGFGHFPGKQNKSVKTGIKNKTGPKNKRDDRTHLTCGRNLQLSKVVEPMLLEVVKPIKKMLDTHKAAFPFFTKHHKSKVSKAMHDAMKFPHGEEPLPHSQVAVCWAEMPENPTKMQKQFAEEGVLVFMLTKRTPMIAIW